MRIQSYRGVKMVALILAFATTACAAPTAPVDLHIYSRLDVAGTPQEATHPVEFRLSASDVVQRGATVRFGLVLSNVGDEPVEFSWSGDEFDIVVTRPDGAVVWERLYGLDFTTSLIVAVLRPGQSIEWTAEWRQRDTRRRQVPRGEYLVRGVLLGNMADRAGWLWTPPVSLLIASTG